MPALDLDRPARVLVGSFNVNGWKCNRELKDWLYMNELPDVVAVGFQELSTSMLQSVITDDADGFVENTWVRHTQRSLNKGDEYVVTNKERCGWACLLVFVHKSFLPHIRRSESGQITCGIGNIAGNKCGVAARLDLKDDTSLVLVTAHMAAHEHEVERRNEDYRRIMQELRFRKSGEGIRRTDHVIFFGDFNYRLTGSRHRVYDLLRDGDLVTLYELDQLKKERAANRVFRNFEEGPITFFPTYKLDTGTLRYDTSEKARTPSWTDRVLFRGPLLRQHTYMAHHTIRFSDHVPVSSLFSFGAQVLEEQAAPSVAPEPAPQEEVPVLLIDFTDEDEISYADTASREPSLATSSLADNGAGAGWDAAPVPDLVTALAPASATASPRTVSPAQPSVSPAPRLTPAPPVANTTTTMDPFAPQLPGDAPAPIPGGGQSSSSSNFWDTPSHGGGGGADNADPWAPAPVLGAVHTSKPSRASKASISGQKSAASSVSPAQAAHTSRAPAHGPAPAGSATTTSAARPLPPTTEDPWAAAPVAATFAPRRTSAASVGVNAGPVSPHQQRRVSTPPTMMTQSQPRGPSPVARTASAQQQPYLGSAGPQSEATLSVSGPHTTQPGATSNPRQRSATNPAHMNYTGRAVSPITGAAYLGQQPAPWASTGAGASPSGTTGHWQQQQQQQGHGLAKPPSSQASLGGPQQSRAGRSSQTVEDALASLQLDLGPSKAQVTARTSRTSLSSSSGQGSPASGTTLANMGKREATPAWLIHQNNSSSAAPKR